MAMKHDPVRGTLSAPTADLPEPQRFERVIEGRCPTCDTALARRANDGWCPTCRLGWAMRSTGPRESEVTITLEFDTSALGHSMPRSGPPALTDDEVERIRVVSADLVEAGYEAMEGTRRCFIGSVPPIEPLTPFNITTDDAS